MSGKTLYISLDHSFTTNTPYCTFTRDQPHKGNGPKLYIGTMTFRNDNHLALSANTLIEMYPDWVFKKHVLWQHEHKRILAHDIPDLSRINAINQLRLQSRCRTL